MQELLSNVYALYVHMSTPDLKVWKANPKIQRDKKTFGWDLFKTDGQTDRIGGVHLYFDRRETTFWLGTLRLSNGAVNKDGTGFCGEIDFRTMQVSVPQEYIFVILPAKGQSVVPAGNTWNIIDAPTDGSDHLFRARGILEYRFALVHRGDRQAQRDALAALKYEDYQYPQVVDEYGPTLTKMPRVDRAKYKATYKGWKQLALDALKDGSKVDIPNLANVSYNQIGPYWMDGLPQGYTHGGFGIDPTCASFEQVNEALCIRAIMHRSNMSRQPCAAYDKATGKPIGLYDWTKPQVAQLMKGESSVELQGRIEITPFLVGDWATYKYKKFNSGNCKYRDELLKFEKIDPAHICRLVRMTIALIEHGDDPAAWDDLQSITNECQLSWFSDRPDEQTPLRNPGLGYYPSTFARWLEEPIVHQGGWIERNSAWMMFCAAAILTYSTDTIQRQQWTAWSRRFLTFLDGRQDKFGFCGRYDAPGYFPAGVRGHQTFHEMLVICHRATLALQICNQAEREYMGSRLIVGLRSALRDLPRRQYGGSIGPPHWIGTEVNGVELPALDNAYCYGEGDPAHVWAACALVAKIATPEIAKEALELAKNHWNPRPDLDQLQTACVQLFPDKSWSVELESALVYRKR